MFKTSVIQGILGLICGLYSFIWGWMHSSGQLRTVMILWTVLAILALVFGYRYVPGTPFYR